MRKVRIPDTLKMTRDLEETVSVLESAMKNSGMRKAVVLSGQGPTRQFALESLAGLSRIDSWIAVPGSTIEDVLAVEGMCFESECDGIVAVGGGKVLDVGKYAAHRSHVPLVAVPTQASHDGIASPIAVIRSSTGDKRSLGARMPVAVVAPLHVVASSPRASLVAGVGDLLSNLSAIEDWRIGDRDGETGYDDFAAMIARHAAEVVRREISEIDLQNITFVRSLMEGLVLSGVAMAVCGSSRPCSGSEHLISHALDYLGLSVASHGCQVGSTMLFCLYVQGKLEDDHVRRLRALGIPDQFAPEGSEVRARLGEVFRVARRMRPGRRTVLDRYSDEHLAEAYETYVQRLSGI